MCVWTLFYMYYCCFINRLCSSDKRWWWRRRRRRSRHGYRHHFKEPPKVSVHRGHVIPPKISYNHMLWWYQLLQLSDTLNLWLKANAVAADSAKRLKQTENAHGDLQRRFDELDRELHTANTDNRRLQDELAQLKKTNDDLQTKLDALTRENNKLTGILYINNSDFTYRVTPPTRSWNFDKRVVQEPWASFLRQILMGVSYKLLYNIGIPVLVN